MNGSNTAASIAMIASTHTISSKVKPRSRGVTHFSHGHVFERNVGGDPAAAFLTVGSVGHDVIRPVLARRAIDVGVVPGIVGNVAALQIGSVPGG